MANGNGDGHFDPESAAEKKVFEGATITLGSLMRQDGLIAESIDKNNAKNAGILHVYTQSYPDDDYRDILKTANWRTPHQRRLAIRALSICAKLGATNTYKAILDEITADSAGEKGWLMQWVFKTLTQTTFITNRKEDGRHDDKAFRSKGSSLQT